MKILVVDDSKAMRMIVKRALGAGGYADATIIEAENGVDGMQKFEAESPDAILCDWNMPEMNGIEFLEALVAKGTVPPFGFVTSESTPEMHERAMSSGAKFLVSKPFTPESLSSALAEAL